MSAGNVPRKFAPTPIEQSVKSSRQRSPPKEKSQVTADETSSTSGAPRRFAPQLVESTSKCSKKVEMETEHIEKKPRRFVPQVVEESQKSSSKRQLNSGSNGANTAHIRFQDSPGSTPRGSMRHSDQENDEPVSQGLATPRADAEKKPPRKFTPILLDIARRSRRSSGSDTPTAQDSSNSKTESEFSIHAQEYQKYLAGKKPQQNNGLGPKGDIPSPLTSGSISNSVEIRKRMSPADRRLSSRGSHSHSFRMPDLDTIESSESEREDSDPSSLSSSPERDEPPFTPSEASYEVYKHATRIRESVDENFTHYLLEVERKKAQKRLEEQALAAFPNADFGYEPPHHYANNDDDSDDMEIEDRPTTFEENDEEPQTARPVHRESVGSMSWEQQEAQRHAEAAQQDRDAQQSSTNKKKESSNSPWWRPGSTAAYYQERPDREIKSMRDRARPPMLGNDLIFPRCPSPEPARFDVTQSPATLRQQALGSPISQGDGKDAGGLWSTPDSPQLSRVTSAAQSPSTTKKAGLWGGFCAADESRPSSAGGSLVPPQGPTGLMTPQIEQSNPFDSAPPAPPLSITNHNRHPHPMPPPINTTSNPASHPTAPPTPPAVQSPDLVVSLNAALVSERELDDHMAKEYPDAFVTQVYNYLSLGYPALARPFDEELAKISRVPIAQLRRDDVKARRHPRGYIRLEADFEGNEKGGEEGKGVGGEDPGDCARWAALRLYIREWARQEKNMVRVDGPQGLGNWGTTARRGSWAL